MIFESRTAQGTTHHKGSEQHGEKREQDVQMKREYGFVVSKAHIQERDATAAVAVAVAIAAALVDSTKQSLLQKVSTANFLPPSALLMGSSL